ncbi:MAG: immune inhibitor A [Anaerolineae bacterium]|nr:immune inhibitor A [Anaerolineae bacterium]
MSTAERFDISPPLSSMVTSEAAKSSSHREIPEGLPTDMIGEFGPQSFDTVVQSTLGSGRIPGPTQSFDGPSNLAGVSPPDPVGDVGPNHYVAMSNLYSAVYDKTGTLLLGPFPNNDLWNGFGGDCETDNSGDPIVLHDQIADRWMLSQFTASGPTYFNCVAISTTPDPTGTYYRYAFSTGTNFPDYPKYGFWSDGLYISTREFAGGVTYVGVGAYAINRNDLISGNPVPQVISFLVTNASAGGAYNIGDGLLPTDFDGSTLPPAGTPNFFAGTMDDGAQYGAPQDAMTLWEFDVDWAVPANSSFLLAHTLTVAPFDSQFPCTPTSRNCIPQPDTSNKVDILSYRQRPLHRLAYRNYGSHESLVTNQSVEAAPNMAGVRWYEVRDPNGAANIYQQGTYAPGVTDGIYRWMGSVAMDNAGNMALGYSASNATSVYPSVWYTGRLASDPLGTMPQGEGSIIDGTGSQTGSGRWGDYTSMNIDPSDDCSFWYVNEYVPTTSSVGWRLRIGSFRFDECGSPDYTMSTSPASQDICEPDDAIYTVSTGSISGYNTPIDLSTVGNPGTESFVPNPVTPGNDSTLTISGATAGNYTFDVVGDSGGNMKTNTVSLNVFDGVPAAPTLVSPADGAVDVPVLPTFTWNAVADATDYTIEIADDAGFTNIIDSATVAGTSYTPGAPLDILTTYWWRVTANNICGVGATSAEWSFTTLEGETISCNGPAVGFELGLPDSWVVDTPFGPVYWSTTDDLAACDNGGNQTPGSGAAACADADQTNQAGDPYDTSLVTNSFDLTGYSTVSLDFAAAFQIYINPDDYFAVEISTDNGATWTQELLWDTNHNNGGENVSLDLSAYAGNADVQARFRYYGEGWNWWAQVDDVALTCEAGGGDPIINVNPGSLAATQPPDTTTMQDLDISNVGGADLDWSIYEDASVMRPVSAGREIATVGANGVAGLAAAGTGTGVRATPESQANRDLVTITHSATNNIVQFNSVSCNAGGLHTDNSYLRVFDLDSFGITDNFDVTEVEIGIEQALGATGSQPISVNLYTLTDPNAPLTFGNLTPIGSTDTTVSDQSLTLWTASVTGTAPAGSVLVVEIFTPDGQTTGNSFFIGSNPDGQTGPSYLAAAACGVPEPLPTGDLGFPGMHIVMNVTGDTTIGWWWTGM